jgi:hypothetical protein
MDTKDIAALLLKTAGLLMFAYAIFEIPYYAFPRAGANQEYSFIATFMQAVAYLTLPIVLGLVLWFFPATVVNKIVAGDKLTDGLRTQDFERLALTVIGLWFVAHGIADLAYHLGSYVLWSRQFPQPQPLEPFPVMIAAIAKVVVGLALAVGAKGVLRLIARVRGEG